MFYSNRTPQRVQNLPVSGFASPQRWQNLTAFDEPDVGIWALSGNAVLPLAKVNSSHKITAATTAMATMPY
jgi:hypothetical protein